VGLADSPNNRRNARAARRVVDQLLSRAARLEREAGELRKEAERMNRIAAAWADGRSPEDEQA
jgi:predicted ATP-grasp superfamily ATP-dependent carboligase